MIQDGAVDAIYMKHMILLVVTLFALIAMVPVTLASNEYMDGQAQADPSISFPLPDAPLTRSVQQDLDTPEYVFVTKWGTKKSYTKDGDFDKPSGIAIDSIGNVYVADTENDRIQKFEASGNFIAKWGRPGELDGHFLWPSDVAVDDSEDFVYALDGTSHCVQKFDSSGSFITSWGSEGTGDGEFLWPHGIAVGAAGDVYVADTDNCRIQKFDNSGNFLIKWGLWGHEDGEFMYPTGITVDASGDVYVADRSNSRIQKVTGQVSTTLPMA
jgi:DNA-binding beta-propeller fold protein YncE